MNWTPEQKQTIETRNKNILVSAAAGSGKTAVLVERIKQLMIRDKVDIDRFLITTFTNAAAAEMKERLEKAVRMELEKADREATDRTGTHVDRQFLKRQLALMPRANISTFHTFALEVMRRFFYVTDLEPGFKIGDEVETSILKNQAVDRLFEDRFSEDYDSFTAFLRKYSSDRSENRIKANIISLYDEMRSIPNYMNWAAERTALLKTEKPSKALGMTSFIFSEYLRILQEAETHYAKAADLLEEAGITSLYAKAQQDVEKLREEARKFGAFETEEERMDALRGFCSGLKFNTMRASKAEQEDYDAVKELAAAHRKRGKSILEELGKKYGQRTLAEYDAELRDSYEDTAYLLELLKDFETIFHSLKQEKNMTDFDDVMHDTLAILQDEMAAAEYRDRFRYIFIDEFQDSNMLQESIIKRIAGENNLFMVGDVKQSIYKFRLAEPEIFKRKYAQYAREEEESSLNIDLNSNFRSKRSVTGTVNNVFLSLLEDYDEKARLHCTIGEEYPGFRSQLHIIEKGKDIEELPENSQLEARQAEQIIREHLGREIYDVKAGRLRPMEYRDIAVLSRSRSMIGELERYLNNAGIPAYGENTGGYFESVEIQVFVNLLRIIDNSRQDIPLISVMRSAIFDFDVKELAAVRIFRRDGAYHDAVKRYAADGPEEALREKISAMLRKITYWKKLKTSVSLEELVRILMYDTGYFDYCSGLPVGKQRISNLRMLVEKAGRFEQNDHGGLYGFLSYIEAMKKSRLTIGEAKLLGEGENVVRVMTVHKSKGLEFPLVILTGTGRTIKFRGIGSSIAMHKDFAIGLPQVDPERKWHRKTLLQRVIEGKKAREEYEEEIRILYVAMTRAMDGLVMTGVVKDPDKLETGSVGRKSFLEMVYGPLMEEGAGIFLHSAVLEDGPDLRTAAARLDLAEFITGCGVKRDEAVIKKIDERLSFEYPYADLENVKSKYSVTELSRRKKEAERTAGAFAEDAADGAADGSAGHTLMRPGFSRTEKVLSAADLGTAMHLVMEKLDFSAAEKNGQAYIRETAEILLEDGWLSREEFDAIEMENIAAFFADPVGKRAAASESLEKEREFILQKEISGVKTIVQGIIDCYFTEDDGIILIDYKNSRLGEYVTEDDIIRRYAEQIELYREALEAANGMRVKEAYLYLFTQRKFVKI